MEVTIGVVFCALWKYFSNVARGLVPSSSHGFSNCAISFITVLYFLNCVIFELLDPVMTILAIRNETSFDWENFFTQIYFIRFMLDFICCMLILYLMHKFGPS